MLHEASIAWVGDQCEQQWTKVYRVVLRRPLCLSCGAQQAALGMVGCATVGGGVRYQFGWLTVMHVSLLL